MMLYIVIVLLKSDYASMLLTAFVMVITFIALPLEWAALVQCLHLIPFEGFSKVVRHHSG